MSIAMRAAWAFPDFQASSGPLKRSFLPIDDSHVPDIQIGSAFLVALGALTAFFDFDDLIFGFLASVPEDDTSNSARAKFSRRHNSSF